MYPNIKKILKISSNELETVNQYLEKGAILLSIDTTQVDKDASQTSYFYIGLTDSSK